MMQEFRTNYPALIFELTTNTLINLYLECAERRGVVTLEKRNLYLIKQLKLLLDNKRYKMIKKDIKCLINAGRKRQSIETKLYDLKALIDNYCNSDVSNFYNFLSLIKEKIGIGSALYIDKNECYKDMLYIHEDHIKNGFNNLGIMLMPLGLMVCPERWQEIEALTENTMFSIELVESTECEANIFLHLKSHRLNKVSLSRKVA
jgi:hypothetical protein